MKHPKSVAFYQKVDQTLPKLHRLVGSKLTADQERYVADLIDEYTKSGGSYSHGVFCLSTCIVIGSAISRAFHAHNLVFHAHQSRDHKSPHIPPFPVSCSACSYRIVVFFASSCLQNYYCVYEVYSRRAVHGNILAISHKPAILYLRITTAITAFSGFLANRQHHQNKHLDIEETLTHVRLLCCSLLST